MLSLAWLGSTGAVPWGYNEDDRWPIWRQYLLLATGALAAAGLLVTFLRPTNQATISRRAARTVGICLALIVLLWAAALLTFALWGGVVPRAAALAIASTAPALTPALALILLGSSVGRLPTILASLGILAAGAAATFLAFA